MIESVKSISRRSCVGRFQTCEWSWSSRLAIWGWQFDKACCALAILPRMSPHACDKHLGRVDRLTADLIEASPARHRVHSPAIASKHLACLEMRPRPPVSLASAVTGRARLRSRTSHGPNPIFVTWGSAFPTPMQVLQTQWPPL